MLNPPELRRTFEAKGEPQVRAELDDGVLSEAVAGIATRWLSAKSKEQAERHAEMLDTQQKMLRQIRTLAYFAAIGSSMSALLSYLAFMHHR